MQEEDENNKVEYDPFVIYWVTMFKYPAWPARKCTPAEEDALVKKKSSKPMNRFIFLGLKNLMGTAGKTMIKAFGPDSEGKLDMTEYNRSADYRGALVEAMRIMANKTPRNTYSEEFLKLMDDAAKEFVDESIEKCNICDGTYLSGSQMLKCIGCHEAHAIAHERCVYHHNIVNNIITGDTTSFLCDTCRKNGLGGLLLSGSALDGIIAAVNSNSSKANDKKKSRSKSTPANEESNVHTNSNNSKVDTSVHQVEKSSQNVDTSHYQEQNNVSTTEIVYEEEDENCFVCGIDGELLFCDYPCCKKLYHKNCVFKLLPKSLLTGSDESMPDIVGESTWFCPRHNCLVCGGRDMSPFHTLNTSTSSSESTNKQQAPSESAMLLSNCMKYNGRKSDIMDSTIALKACDSCPFTICSDCENTITVNKSIFRKKRNTTSTCCLNCTTPSARISLAKILEQAWTKMSNSRLSTPFLRPLLPITAPISSTSSSKHTKNKLTNQVIEANVRHDLLYILEKIHAFHYHSSRDMMYDLNTIRNEICAKLRQTTTTTSAKVNIDKDYLDILLAYDTLIEPAFKALINKDIIIKQLENEIVEELENRHTKVIVSYRKNNDINNNDGVRTTDTEQNSSNSNSNSNSNTTSTEDEKVITSPGNGVYNHELDTSRGGVDMTVDNGDDYDEDATSTANSRDLGKSRKKRRRTREIDRLTSNERYGYIPLTLLSSVVNNDARTSFIEEIMKISGNVTSLNASNHQEKTEQQQQQQQTSSNSKSSTKQKNSRSRKSSSDPYHNTDNMYLVDIEQIRMENLWRLECHSHSVNLVNSNNKMSYINKMKELLRQDHDEKSHDHDSKRSKDDHIFPKITSHSSQIDSRSLIGWLQYVRTGAMPGKSFDAFFQPTLIASEGAKKQQEQQSAKDFVGNILRENKVENMLSDQYQAVQLLVGMHNNPLRESVTIPPLTAMMDSNTYDNDQVDLFGASDNIIQRATKHYQQSTHPDNVVVILDRMQEIIDQTSALQHQLRHEYVQRQRTVFDTSSQVLTIGQVHIFTELKLANEQLRWQVTQRDQALQRCQSTVDNLRSTTHQYEQQLLSLESENALLKEKLAASKRKPSSSGNNSENSDKNMKGKTHGTRSSNHGNSSSSKDHIERSNSKDDYYFIETTK